MELRTAKSILPVIHMPIFALFFPKGILTVFTVANITAIITFISVLQEETVQLIF